MILHPTEPKVIAVLDWELSTLGDPLADFTYHLMNWVMPSSDSRGALANIEDLNAYGIPTMEEYIDMYCAHRGLNGMPDVHYYFAYNGFRLAGIVQGIVGRVRDGTASNANAAQMAERVPLLAKFAYGEAQKAGLAD